MYYAHTKRVIFLCCPVMFKKYYTFNKQKLCVHFKINKLFFNAIPYYVRL